MDIPWAKNITDTGELTVFNGASVGKWATIFKLALTSFNRNSGLKMKMVEAKKKDTANIVVQVAGGTTNFEYDGTSYPVVFPHTLVHGLTKTFARDGFIEKAAIFLPSEPDEDHKNVLRFITVHELIHASGLVDHDNDGVFMSLPNIRKGLIWSSANSKKMPPLFFDPKTIARLQKVWQ